MSSLLILLLIALATFAALELARHLPWSQRARDAALPLATGLALGPLLAGFCAVVTLGVLPGAPQSIHLLVVLGVLATPALFGWRRLDCGLRMQWPRGWLGRLALLIIVGYVFALVIDSSTVPLIQNDALEYAIVARDLFQARDIAAYPALHPDASASGFFGPWTHPPLYVALIYLCFAAVGDAESTWALRVIAPWCLVVTTVVVLALGRMHSSRSGWLGALVFVSTPLLFLGAASALIDPLPVLGFALIVAGLTGFMGGVAASGAGLGLILGLSLWTHSQAVLFPFLAWPALWLVSGPNGSVGRWRVGSDWSRWFLTVTFSLLVAALIGFAPYLRNFSIYGSPISDNPAVFALPSLQWAEYFRLQRGVGSLAEIVQYGVFKGFFAVEAYSFAFWLALAGIPSAWRSMKNVGALVETSAETGTSAVPRVALAICLTYLAATALSAAVGIDLMIRNERYLLVLIPCAALLAGVGASAARPLRSKAGLATLLVISLSGAQLLVLVFYRQGQLQGGAGASGDGQLDRWGPYASVRYLASATPPKSVVMSMKPADMFYSQRRMLSYLDPRMLPFYGIGDDIASAAAELRSVGASYLHVPDYFLPPMYSSQLMSLVSDPTWTEIVEDAGGYQIYALRHKAEPVALKQLEATSGEWVRQSQLIIGGRKALKRVVLGETTYRLGEESRNSGMGGFFGRDFGKSLISSIYVVEDLSRQCASNDDRFAELIVDVSLHGLAHAQVLALIQGAEGERVQRRLLGDRPTLTNEASTVVRRRIRLPRDSSTLKLAVEHSGISRLVIESASVKWMCGPAQLPVTAR